MKETIYRIMHSRFNVPNNLLDGTHDSDALTGPVFGFTGLGMTYLFLEIEKELKCFIDATKLLHYEFNSIDGIVDVLNKQGVC